MMKHCFAICAYQDSPYLEACLRSVTEQSVPTRVILCTSTPSAMISDLAARFGVPVYVREGESSLKADWNFAVETAVREEQAELVTVAHQDDIYLRDYVKALRAAWKVYPDLSVFCTRYRVIDKNGDPMPGKAEAVKRWLRLPLRLRKCAHLSWIKRSALIFGNSIGCPTCTYAVARTGLPLFRNDYHFVIDWVTLLRLAGMPGRFVCIEKVLLEYRIHDQAETWKTIRSHIREKEESETFASIWPRPVVRLIIHFYKTIYSAYGQSAEDKKEQ